MIRTPLLFIFLLLACLTSYGQFQFTGQVKEDLREGTLYLSIVEDYRKLKGIHSEQILQKTQVDSSGRFLFSGNNLPLGDRIYRIHIDTCPDSDLMINHFSGHCENSREILFVANNTDRIDFPFSFESEMFCSIDGSNPQASVFLRIDSLQNDMLYAMASYSSPASEKANSELWFQKLQEFGKTLKEPLGEVYIYSLLSDRGSRFYEEYLKDLKANPYYDELLLRLEESHPEAPYAQQLEEELEADRYIVNRRESIPWWAYLIVGVLAISFLLNFFIIGKWLRYRKAPAQEVSLSNQEEKIRDLILQDKTNKEIAQELFISVSTVKTHINSLYKKLGVTSRDKLKSRFQ